MFLSCSVLAFDILVPYLKNNHVFVEEHQSIRRGKDERTPPMASSVRLSTIAEGQYLQNVRRLGGYKADGSSALIVAF